MNYMYKVFVVYILLLMSYVDLHAQERVGALQYIAPRQDNAGYSEQSSRSVSKTTAITLPFFEDFTNNSFFPDTSKWLDRKVYINNNMGVDPISRGVATFDAIDENGLPYEPEFNTVLRYADSLTSQKLDLSSYSIGDSIYFSFFYQPAGNGFDPQPEDSLMLYFRRSSSTTPWTRVWRVAGSSLKDFEQVMIPVDDAKFFHEGFQFRFVNKASINNADDHWHVDYIRIDANRGVNDTAVVDIAFVKSPTFLLNDYTYMPYHQFIANASGERASQHETSIRNNTGGSVSVNYGYEATEIVNGTSLSSGNNSVNIDPNTESVVSFPIYTNTGNAPVKNGPVTFEQMYYIQSSGSTGNVENDTIIRQQYFHNYLAYDDGTPEKSYYLNLFATLPGKIAIEHRLNVPDTLKGIAIYFGRQVPLAYQKYFSVAVYKDIGYNGGTEDLIYQEDFLIPGYLQQNSFWYYRFETPVALPAGKFYIGTIQPALGASDSLYFGLDVHRTANNHVFYNVLNSWEQSSISGAVMMRPLFGDFYPSDIKKPIETKRSNWDIVPNPATDQIQIKYSATSENVIYSITNLAGVMLKSGKLERSGVVSLKGITPGVYLVSISVNGNNDQPKKIIKL